PDRPRAKPLSSRVMYPTSSPRDRATVHLRHNVLMNDLADSPDSSIGWEVATRRHMESGDRPTRSTEKRRQLIPALSAGTRSIPYSRWKSASRSAHQRMIWSARPVSPGLWL